MRPRIIRSGRGDRGKWPILSLVDYHACLSLFSFGDSHLVLVLCYPSLSPLVDPYQFIFNVLDSMTLLFIMDNSHLTGNCTHYIQ
jgi:hypothetical protein